LIERDFASGLGVSDRKGSDLDFGESLSVGCVDRGFRLGGDFVRHAVLAESVELVENRLKVFEVEIRGSEDSLADC
jgi:hypothetical protein